MIHKFVAGSLAAAIAAGASLVNGAAVVPAPAYGVAAVSFEADAAARAAASRFDRADLNNDRALDEDEFKVLAIVTAELGRLNGFFPIEIERGVRTVALPERSRALTGEEKGRLGVRASREFALVAGDDERLALDEFVGAALEQFLASDRDRNGVLREGELTAFAQAQSGLAAVSS